MDHHTTETRCPKTDDKVARDVIFLFISTRTMATIEFPQQELINDGKTSKSSTCIAAARLLHAKLVWVEMACRPGKLRV
jgi:hypothetical protein